MKVGYDAGYDAVTGWSIRMHIYGDDDIDIVTFKAVGEHREDVVEDLQDQFVQLKLEIDAALQKLGNI